MPHFPNEEVEASREEVICLSPIAGLKFEPKVIPSPSLCAFHHIPISRKIDKKSYKTFTVPHHFSIKSLKIRNRDFYVKKEKVRVNSLGRSKWNQGAHE
jgi:hypothetical protein